jgi:hypothetical protein
VAVVSVTCCQVGVSATGRSLIQRNLTECGVSECDCEASIMARPLSKRVYCSMENKSIMYRRNI